MVDLKGLFDVFIITNGRSTFEYCHKAIQNQYGVDVNVHILRDMPWVDANNHCLSVCGPGLFLRVDDDMFLHPKALLFIAHQVNSLGRKYRKRMAMRFWKLWEPWRGQSVNGIKLYSKRIVKRIGGFKPNHLGKIDGTFKESVARSRYHSGADKSMFAVHACSTFEENLRYAQMRGEEKGGKGFRLKIKRLKKDINRYQGTVESQYEMAVGKHLEDLNRRRGRESAFYKFLQENNFLQIQQENNPPQGEQP